MTRRPTRRKCRQCNKFFVPDFRNTQRQRFCDQPECRHASKRASQRRWLGKKANRDYFRGQAQVRRVQEWRRAHPGYWRRKTASPADPQTVEPQQGTPPQGSCNVPRSLPGALQDSWLTEAPAFVGLISMVTGSTLQDDIAATSRRLILHGQNILGLKAREPNPSTTPPDHDLQTFAPARAAPSGASGL